MSEAVSYSTYVKDISEISRKTGKIFYGFVPLSGARLVIVKWSMYLLSFCQLLGKSLQMSILFQVGGGNLVLLVMSAEVGIYLSYKIARRDFRYWLPVNSFHSVWMSVISRITVKIISDFTGFLHARHPYEMGGFYWLFNMVLTQASVFGSIMLKEELGRSVGGVGKGSERVFIKGEDYMSIATALLVAWSVAIFGLILFSEIGERARLRLSRKLPLREHKC